MRGAGSWKLEAGSWKREAGSWKREAGSYSCFLRSMTPESTTAPVREIVLKKS
jgi:hypothetical protein